MSRTWKSSPSSPRELRRAILAMALIGAASAGARPLPFEGDVTLGTLSQVSSVATGDFNGDGLLDLAAASFVDNEVAWFEWDGAAFIQHSVTGALSGPMDLASGDIDCDGDVDLAIAVNGAGHVIWARNLAGAGWNLGATISTTAPGVTSLEVLDLEPDGDLDVVGTVSDNGEIVRWRSDGCAGAIWTATAIASGLDTPYRLDVGDIDGDGRTDVVAADPDLGLLAYWKNPGTAGAWVQVPLASGWGGASSASLGDVDGDGDIDVAGAATSSEELAWWENPGGAGAWIEHPVAAIPQAFAVECADLDRDGDIDLLASTASIADTGWWENVDGDGGAWAFQAIDSLILTLGFVAGDFDGDGDIDAATATASDGLRYFENASTHRSARLGLPDLSVGTVGIEIADVATGDIDGDGLPDMVFAERDLAVPYGHVSWYRNLGSNPDGSASFEFVNLPHVAPDSIESIALGDVDEDGDVDVVVGERNAIALTGYFCRNGGAGASWTCFAILPSGPIQVDALELADIDRDSDLDLLSAVVESPLGPLTAIWWENPVDSTTPWTRHDIGALTEFPDDLRVVDLHADGDLDVVSGSEHWWRNNGGSPPTWTARTLPGSSPGAIETGDLDGDGDLDLAFERRGSNAIGWYENQSSSPGAVWAEHEISPWLGGNLVEHDVALADFDLDGDLDLAAGHSDAFEDRMSWFRNEAGVWHEAPIEGLGPIVGSYLVCGDFHRDGDADLLAFGRENSNWTSFWNTGGQFALKVAGEAPPTLAEGNEAPLFRLELSHRGRAGDAAIELAALALRLEKSPGQPLTTIELAEAVSFLKVYLDDGSGTFEPGSDTFVAAFAPPVLAAGEAVLDLPDLPSLEVSAAVESKLFFLTIALAPTALGSGVTDLVVTHEPTHATAAENASHDTPLTAEPAAAVVTELEIVAGVNTIFSDGFESQDTTAWSSTTP